MIADGMSSARSGTVSKEQGHRLEENVLPVRCPLLRPVLPFSVATSVFGVVCSVHSTVQ